MPNQTSKKTLIIDIETVGENFEEMDDISKEVLTRWIKKESESDEEYNERLNELKDGLGFSPLTGQIVAIGTMDYERGNGAVYYQAPGEQLQESNFGEVKLQPTSEKEMLEKFWEVAGYFQEFVTFNGRGFDLPFVFIRSAIHGVKVTKNLMANRYLSSQPYDAKHIDLLDQLTFYGSVRRKGGLHLWCRAFGIKSPKSDGITGDDVSKLFCSGEYKKIAEYNVGDLIATKELFRYWNDYLKF